MKRLIAIAAVTAFAQAATAQTLLYSNTFESGPIGSEWSSNTMRIHASPFTWFVGRYTENQSVTLSLNAPPPANCGGSGGGSGGGGGTTGGGGTSAGGGDTTCFNQFFLTFDLFIIDSWDGYLTPHGPDFFQVFVNGSKIFEETFTNQHTYQSFRAPDVGPTHLGFNPAYKDSIYRDIMIPFEIGEASTINIKFRGQGLLSLDDESWGIDNVRVSFTPVPSPGSAVLLAAGAALTGLRRRR